MNEKKNSKFFSKCVTKAALTLGEKSVSSACSWWFCQPKVPASMQKTEKK